MSPELEQLKKRYGLNTSFVYPPILVRDHDWCAYQDPESRRQGWGKTEAEAVQDWIENYGEEEKSQ